MAVLYIVGNTVVSDAGWFNVSGTTLQVITPRGVVAPPPADNTYVMSAAGAALLRASFSGNCVFIPSTSTTALPLSSLPAGMVISQLRVLIGYSHGGDWSFQVYAQFDVATEGLNQTSSYIWPGVIPSIATILANGCGIRAVGNMPAANVLLGNSQYGPIKIEITYTLITPIVTSVTPGSSSAGVATDVTIIGQNFDDGSHIATVTFDGNPATNVVVVNNTTITCKAPKGYIGLVNVAVTNVNGTGTKVNGYEYTSTVVLVYPPMGEVIGGTLVNIKGTGFAGLGVLTNVYFDALPATEIVVIDDSNISCRTPSRVGILPVWVYVTVEFDSVDTVTSPTEIYLYEVVVTNITISGTTVTITVDPSVDPTLITTINLVDPNGVSINIPVWTTTPTTITFTIPTLTGPTTIIANIPTFPGPIVLGVIPMTIVGSGGIEFGGSPEIVVTKELSGIYTLVPDKLTDTFYDRLTGQTSIEVEIPDPEFKTGYIGG